MARYSPAFRRIATRKAAAPKPRRKPAARSGSVLEEALAQQIRFARFPAPVREFRFHPTRRWRLDFAYPDIKLGIEVDGGTWTGGRHVTGKGFEEDAVKTNAAAALGWRVLRVTSAMVRDGRALLAIEEALSAR